MNSETNNSIENISRIEDLKEVLSALWDGKYLIFAVTAFLSIISVIYSLSLPNIYQSKAVLSPVTNEIRLSSSLSTIASFSGLNIPSQSELNKTAKAIKKMNSLSFFSENVMPNIFLPDLMALESWDSNSNTIRYDEEIYDQKKQSWIVDTGKSQKVPTNQESFLLFKKRHLSVTEDNKTGFVTITINHQSPYIAKEWVEIVVNEINSFFRAKDKQEAQAAVDFLNLQVANTNFAEIKEAIAELIQQKTQQLTLIEVSDFYIFEYIDAPAIMEKKSEPRRSIICILGALMGAMLGIAFVLINKFFFNNEFLRVIKN
tara:strand:- start:3261 stop:4208 length:948 start_codon:yes stop_codon:yes gene_type:complete